MLQPFEWGRSDCCLAVCDVLADMGHPDPAAGFRGRYSDEAGARAVMGGPVADVAARVCQRLGWQPVPLAEAEDGDVGVYGNSLAIFSDGWWHMKSEGGYVMKRNARRAWRPV